MSDTAEPLASILIPAYNSERWLAATVRSALAQSWRKTEIIIVDDGSVDGTLSIAKQFRSKNVQVVSQKHQGAAAARNKAYSYCQGKYIQWLDADDLLHPDKIRLQIEAVQKIDVSKRTLLSSSWGSFFCRIQKARFSPTALWCDLPPAEWMIRKMEQNIHIQTSAWLASRELTEAAGPWDTRMLIDDDGEYFCRMMLYSDEIRFVPGAMSYYRLSGSNRLSYMGRSNPKRDAQFLSMRLHIQYLLSIADHQRSRAACCRYLQNWLFHFYPERPDIVRHAHQLAAELGGILETPKISWKYWWIQKLFGWKAAHGSQIFFSAIKRELICCFDEALLRLEAILYKSRFRSLRTNSMSADIRRQEESAMMRKS